MNLSSPKIIFDKRLLAIEEQFRQRKYRLAVEELQQLEEKLFESQPHELGLYQLLVADGSFHEGNYRRTIECGLSAAKILAGYPLN
ncbi:MAG: hypothetical protein KAW91_01705, partial [candidate division Zixibacteria bacterium]|nr:hypothetical protein [candidate division Zixibacteria bacterium]